MRLLIPMAFLRTTAQLGGRAAPRSTPADARARPFTTQELVSFRDRGGHN